MSPKDQEARARILQAAIALLAEESDLTKITVRQIAEQAEVSLGSINYYFQSKENLFSEAVMQSVGDVAANWFDPFGSQDTDPQTRLRQLFKETSSTLAGFPQFAQIYIEQAIKQGNFEVPTQLVPLLRKIFGSQKSELEIRLLALQLIIPLWFATLHPEALQRYAGVDLFVSEQRDAALDILINNVLKA